MDYLYLSILYRIAKSGREAPEVSKFKYTIFFSGYLAFTGADRKGYSILMKLLYLGAVV